MPLDFAGLSALSGLSPWQEIREGNLRDEQRAQIISANAQQDLQHQKQALQELNDAAQQIGKTDILSFDPNLKDLREKEKDFRSRISEGIKKHNGDISNYMDSTGEIDKQKYINDIVNSDAMQRGKLNSLYYNLANVADQKGMTLRKVSWKPVGWKEGDKLDSGTIQDNLQALKDGKTKELNYAGAYSAGNFTPDFHLYYDPKNPYKPKAIDVPTYVEHVYSSLKTQGMNKQDALEQANQMGDIYGQQLKAGATPYSTKYDPAQGSAYWRMIFSAANRKEEDEDDAIKNLAGTVKKADDPNSDIWTETVPSKEFGLPSGTPGSELVPRGTTPEIKVSHALDGYKLPPAVIEQTVPTKDGTKQQYTTLRDNQILGLQYVGGKPMVATTETQANSTLDPKKHPLWVPLSSLGSAELTKSFTKPSEAANKFNKYYGGEKKSEQPKHISTAKLQSLVGTPGYEGLTVKELAKYYADHGYTIQ